MALFFEFIVKGYVRIKRAMANMFMCYNFKHNHYSSDSKWVLKSGKMRTLRDLEGKKEITLSRGD